MLITRRSTISGKIHTIEIDVTEDQIKAYMSGMHVQNAFPNLTADEREFILIGITADEWDEIFSEEKDDYSNEEAF